MLQSFKIRQKLETFGCGRINGQPAMAEAIKLKRNAQNLVKWRNITLMF